VLGGCDDPVEPVTSDDAALVLVQDGFSLPVFLTAPPGDMNRLFVVEQGGLVRIVRDDSILTAPFLNVTTLINCCNERGLLGMAFHPQYATNGTFYVHYSNTAGHTRVMRYQVSANPDVADAGSASQVLAQNQPFDNHNGGMLAFGPDGYLYIGLGDGGSGGDPQGNAQNPATLLGKMLRIDVNVAGVPYGVPPTNPFVANGAYRGEIWALGLRNPWRYSFDRTTGDLYIADVGQGDVEEIDVEPAHTGGRNYGWNPMEGSGCYVAGCSTSGLTLPVHEYTHADGCSVTGGYVYRGQAIPAITGRYFYADYCDGWVRSFRWTSSQATEHLDWPALAPGGTISSFGEDGVGELYIVSRSAGAVYRVIPPPATP